MEDKDYIYARAANGLTVRIPADRYPQWKQAQEEIKAGKRKADPEKAARLSALIRGDALQPSSKEIPPVANPPRLESSLDLLLQLRDECEQEQASSKEPQTVIVRRGSPKWVTVLLGFLCAASLTGCIAFGFLFLQSSQSLTSLQGEIGTLQYNLKSRNQAYRLLLESHEKILPEYDFFHGHAVIVTLEGEKFHRYGCGHIQNRSKWFIIDSAVAPYTYDPCLDCID